MIGCVAQRSSSGGVTLTSAGPASGGLVRQRRGGRRIAGRLLVHVIAPAALVLALIALYFSGVPALAALVAPTSNRELGLLEHLQLVALGVLIVLAVRASRGDVSRTARGAWAVAAAAAAFVFLEEMDYGLHYYELVVSLVTGTPPVTLPSVRNVHNIGENTDLMKLVSDVLVGVLFVLIPFAPTERRKRFAQRGSARARLRELVGTLSLAADSPVRPNRWYIATVGVMVVTAQIPHALVRAGYTVGSLGANLSEFRELLIYYLIALYAYESCGAPLARPAVALVREAPRAYEVAA